MKKIFSLLFLIGLFFNISLGQSGDYFISHYAPSDEKIDYRSVAMTQDAHGVIFFANKSGVLEFDGRNWRINLTPGAVYTLSTYGNDVFAGGLFGFGKLSNNKGSQASFTSLSQEAGIFSSVTWNDRVYFCNEKKIFVYSPTQNKIEKIIESPGADLFHGLLIINDKLLVVFEKGGQRIVDGDHLSPSPISVPANEKMLFSLTSDSSKQTYIATDAGKLYKTNAANLEEIPLADGDLLKRYTLLNGTLINDNLLALGTLRGGVLFINPKTGKTVETINYFNGLPDNEVVTLLTDKNRGVWVSHEYGFSRIAPFLPFRSYNHYEGLKGNLLCVQSKEGALYAGTTLGLFRLTKEEVLQEITVEDSQQAIAAQEKAKKKFLGVFKKKKEKSETAPATKKVKHIFKSTRYVYKQVNNIESKVTQLLIVDGKLLAIGLDGAFEIDGLNAKVILDAPVRSIFLSPTLKQLFLGTYQDGVRTFAAAERSGWRETHLLDTLNDYVSHIFEDKLQNIWLCARTNIYKMELVDGEITDLVAVPIKNPSLDETVGLAYGRDVYIAASGEFKKFDGKDQFLKYDSLPGPRKYFASAGYFWFYDGHKWRTVDRKIQSLKLEWLGLFPYLRFLAPDENNSGLWLITADNQLYRFSNSQGIAEDKRYPLFLKEVKGQTAVLQDKSMKINQPENTVSFEFIEPNYVGFQSTEYRYQVKGLTNTWSTWSNLNNIVPFPYLAPGTYQLLVQSRDLLGNESKVETINFEVLPPYWKRWWFYLLEFLFFSSLVLITVKLSRGDERYRPIARVLTLLTVIMLIQLIQTGIDSFIAFKSTPIIEFFIQVTMALVILPVEGVLRKLMLKASTGDYKIKLPRSRKPPAE